MLGKNQDIFLTHSLDTWANEVRGSSARVFLGTYHHSNGYRRNAAFKFMRPDEIEYAKPMFVEEAVILNQLHDVPGVMRMLKLGFVRFDNIEDIPPDKSPGNAKYLSGEIISFNPKETDLFLKQYEVNISEDWLPYFLLGRSFRQENLLLLCDKRRNRGKYFPLDKGLTCAIQACEILQAAHDRNIVYRDQKSVP